MCTVSAVSDGWREQFPGNWPLIPSPVPEDITPYVTAEEFAKLRREVEELRELLKAAKRFDEATDQPDCQMEEKIEFIKRMAEVLGVDLEDVFD